MGAIVGCLTSSDVAGLVILGVTEVAVGLCMTPFSIVISFVGGMVNAVPREGVTVGLLLMGLIDGLGVGLLVVGE